MGATWHTKSMFDLETKNYSFAKLLNQQGIETYAVDILGSGPGEKPKFIGDLYDKTLSLLSKVVHTNGIDSIMGYSTGCAFVTDLCKTHLFKKIIFLDPGARVTLDKTCQDNDRYVITKTAVSQALTTNQTAVDDITASYHLSALCAGSELVTAAYPITGQYLKKIYKSQTLQKLLAENKIKTFFTKHSVKPVRDLFQANHVYWPHASHWILLEPYRIQLAHEIEKFLVHE